MINLDVYKDNKVYKDFSDFIYEIESGLRSEKYVSTKVFSRYCIWLIDKALKSAAEDSKASFKLRGTSWDYEISFIADIGIFKDDLLFAKFSRDIRGFYSITLFYRNRLYIVEIDCVPNKEMNMASKIQKSLRKYFDKLTIEEQCLLEISGLKDIKEVFDL